MKVEQQDLNLWSQRTLFLTTTANIVLVVAGLIFLFRGLYGLFRVGLFVTILDYVGIIAAVPVSLGLFRNAILLKWIREKDFDFIYRVQVIAYLLFLVGAFLGFVFMVVAYALPTTQPVSLAAYALVVWGAALVVYRLTDMFRSIFRETTLGALCLESYLVGVKEGFVLEVNREHLMKGVEVFEKCLRKCGVHIPHEKIAFVFNVALLKGVTLDSDLNNFVASLRNPTPENLKAAISSSQDLLSFSKGFTDRGLQIPTPFWRKLAAPRIFEFYGNLANLVYFAVLLTATILTLLGVKIL